MPALDELPSEFLGVFGMGLGRNKVFQLARRDDARVGNLLDELFEGNGHSLPGKKLDATIKGQFVADSGTGQQ